MYYKLRKYNTDIHVYEFKDEILTLTGEVKRTPLSKINHDYWEGRGKTCLAKINAGYFNWSSLTNTSGVDYRDEGFTFSDTIDGDEFIEIVFSDKKIRLFDGTLSDCKAKFPKAEWIVSAGPPLIDKGKTVNYKNTFAHSNSPNPRTIIGQKKCGIILLVVAEGRNKGDTGLTIEQSKALMLELECETACNLDGGGSSEMIVDGKIKNYITSERAIGTALLVYGEKKIEYPKVIGKVKISKNFTLDEIACRCCGEVKFPDYRLIEIAQLVRTHFGKAIKLVGYRCKEHNTSIGGDPNSYHMIAEALDISAWHYDIKPIDIYNYILSLPNVKRAKYYKGSHVHIQTSWLEQI